VVTGRATAAGGFRSVAGEAARLVLQGNEFSNGIALALRPRTPVGRPAPAADWSAGVTGALSGLPLGSGKRPLALWWVSFGHCETPCLSSRN
jgi:hypothetical protein